MTGDTGAKSVVYVACVRSTAVNTMRSSAISSQASQKTVTRPKNVYY